MRELKVELKRVTEERDILKKAAAYLPGNPVRYAFIKTHEAQHSVRGMYRMMESQRLLCLAYNASLYVAAGESTVARADQAVLAGKSDGVYDYCKITHNRLRTEQALSTFD